MERLEDIALIGNCQIAAHVRADGAVVWCCMPRFDAEPLFGALLDSEGGQFIIGLPDASLGEQAYLPNTNVLVTTFHDARGSFRVIDFAPRFVVHDRMFRPTKLVRIVQRIAGSPQVRVHCDPILGWSKARPRAEVGSHHVSFHGYPTELRLTTNASLAYLDGRAFVLTYDLHFVLAWGAPVEEPLEPLCTRFLTATVRYWQRWVRQCNVPTLHQEATLRSALTLKLHCYEDTGAIAAALTTSLPESPGAGRTWDYRYCWLRDAYYVLDAFRLLGHFEERERFVEYLQQVAARGLDLAPLYRIDAGTDLEERIEPRWRGFAGEGPVRVGNGAALHQQHDVFGELVLALAPICLDARFADHVTPQLLDTLEGLARRAVAVAGTPDAGIWELRTEWKPQTFSSLMCWAAADRFARVAARHRPERAAEFREAAEGLRREILSKAVDAARGCLVAEYGGSEVDAAVLQAISLGFTDGLPDLANRTIDAVVADLDRDGWLLRYRVDDGFGRPDVAFAFCTYWLVEALARVGRVDEARAILERIVPTASPTGLRSEDVDPSTGRLWGNYPQAYSHVGLVHAVFAASPRW